MTYMLIGLNILVFVWSLFNYDYIINTYGFKPAEFVLITVFTSMFLHAG
jgi:membrane associated rhomboid family serine protease